MNSKILIFSIVLTFVFKSMFSQYNANDCAILLALDAECDSSNRLDWNTDPNPGGWDGVSWSAGRVTSLSLYNKQLKGTFSLSGLNNLTYLNCSGNELSDIKLSDLNQLTTLLCGINQIDSLDVAAIPNLTYVHCQQGHLNYLNIAGLTNLTMLFAGENELSSLNTTGLPNLDYFNIEENQLDSLDLSGLAKVQQLYASKNKITKLKTSGVLPEMLEIYLGDNQLSNIDLSVFPNLSQFECSNNLFTHLDLSDVSQLTGLYCSKNKIDSLDLSNMTRLRVFSCDSCQLKSLDISNSLNMYYFSCIGNQLDTLDLSKMTELYGFFCSDNHLDVLKVSPAANFFKLECMNNRLPFSSLATAAHTEYFDYNPQDTLYRPITIYKDTMINYSSEALIKGKPTNFVFFKDNMPADTNNTGFFSTTGFGDYYCTMVNDTFPGLTLITSVVSIPGLSVSDTALVIDADDKSTVTFEINSNTAWNIASSDGWLVPNGISGSKSAVITLTGESNSISASRTAVITVSGTGFESKTIKVEQAAPVLFINESTLEIGYAANSTVTFTITSNITWDVTSSENWLTANPASEEDDASVTLTAQTNTSINPRVAIVEVVGGNLAVRSITVTQLGQPVLSFTELSESNTTFYPNPVNTILTVELASKNLPANISIYALDGNLIMAGKAVSENTQLDMSDFQSGMYILKIVSSFQTIEERIIKQ